MKNTKTINMTGYTVEYVDLRQSKPRTVNKETVVLDADTIRGGWHRRRGDHRPPSSGILRRAAIP